MAVVLDFFLSQNKNVEKVETQPQKGATEIDIQIGKLYEEQS